MPHRFGMRHHAAHTFDRIHEIDLDAVHHVMDDLHGCVPGKAAVIMHKQSFLRRADADVVEITQEFFPARKSFKCLRDLFDDAR